MKIKRSDTENYGVGGWYDGWALQSTTKADRIAIRLINGDIVQADTTGPIYIGERIKIIGSEKNE